MPESVAPFSVYTILNRSKLDSAFRCHRFSTFHERKRWVSAVQLWMLAQKRGEHFAAVLADAKDCANVIYWGIVTDITLDDDGTSFSIRDLVKVEPPRPTQTLVLQSSGRTISVGYRRPYAIVRRPQFVPVSTGVASVPTARGRRQGSLKESPDANPPALLMASDLCAKPVRGGGR